MRESPRRENRTRGIFPEFQKQVFRWILLYQRQSIRRHVIRFLSRYPLLGFLTFIIATIFGLYFWFLILVAGTKSSLFSAAQIDGDISDLHIPESEIQLSGRFVCTEESLENNVKVLSMCGSFQKSKTQRKIVGLVEVRNVEQTIHSFLTALSHVVDSVVILDDHSSDLTRNIILSFNTEPMPNSTSLKRSHPVIEALLNKSGAWSREELFDRQILLQTGRRVGGTHFVLLDYDEYFSSNCITNGLLRSSILDLKPGESLFIPWVELWKSPRVHAVLKENPNLNFLRRRQITIFADDKETQYTERNSIAKLFSTNSTRPSSIHVLRCPRSLCPQPPRKSDGMMTSTRGWANVRVLPQCRLLEMRFLNLDNMLLKSAWYEALGRVMGADDGVTLGKMVNTILNNLKHSTSGQDDHTFSVVHTDPRWLAGIDEEVFKVHSRVELWRAREILQWADVHGEGTFVGLNVLSMIDLGALRNSVDRLKNNGNREEKSLIHVPRKKVGSLVLAVDSTASPVLIKFLKKLGWYQIDIMRNMQTEGSIVEKESAQRHWNESVIASIIQAMRTQNSKKSFIVCSASDGNTTHALLQIARNELSFLNVFILFGDRVQSVAPNQSELFQRAISYALEGGSHISALDIPLASFGSASTLLWLQDRLEQGRNYKNILDTTLDVQALMFAEFVHMQYKNSVRNLAPVARLMFSLNVGRSGSKHLARVLSTASDPVIALHEPSCPTKECTKGGGMRMQDQPLSTSYHHRARVKRKMIRQSIAELLSKRGRGGHRTTRFDCAVIANRDFDWNHKRYNFSHGNDDADVAWERREIFEIDNAGHCEAHIVLDALYIETNPNFKAWIYDIVLDEFPVHGYDVTVIIVRKFIGAVLKSLFETGFFSSRDGYTWMETAAGVNSKIKAVSALAQDSGLDAMDRLLSYIVNAEAVFRDVVKKYQDNRRVRFYDMRAEQLYTAEGMRVLFENLRVGMSDSTLKIATKVHDKYGEGDKPRVGSISVKDCEERAKMFVSRTGKDAHLVADLLKNWTRVEGFNYRE